MKSDYYKFEIQMMDDRIKWGKKHCNMLLFSLFTCIAILIINTATLINGNLSLLSAFASGSLFCSSIFIFVNFLLERMELKLEIERKEFYEKNDIDERLRLRELGEILHGNNNKK